MHTLTRASSSPTEHVDKKCRQTYTRTPYSYIHTHTILVHTHVHHTRTYTRTPYSYIHTHTILVHTHSHHTRTYTRTRAPLARSFLCIIMRIPYLLFWRAAFCIFGAQLFVFLARSFLCIFLARSFLCIIMRIPYLCINMPCWRVPCCD